MSVKFKILPRKNPQDALAPEKYYATAIGDGSIDLDTLATAIAYQCTLTESDCHAVLLSLVHNVNEQLSQGRIVRLGKLGTFQVGISALGKNTPEEVNASSIIKSRILFKPAKKMREMLTTLSYRKAG